MEIENLLPNHFAPIYLQNLFENLLEGYMHIIFIATVLLCV